MALRCAGYWGMQMTFDEELIERTVCTRTDRIDARYMSGKITTDEYRAAMDQLTAWAEREYDRINVRTNA